MNVLSLFDGMSCGQLALERAGIKVDKYYASEIDKYAIQITMANYPNTIQLGSVVDVDGKSLPKIDLLIGGSPCQSFSFAGKRKGMSTKDEQEILTLEHYLELKEEGYEFEGQSYLFWEYMRLLTEVKPTYFLLENVMMGEKWERVLSKAIGYNPIEINSALVSAQNRRRLYWTNIGMQPMGLFGDLESIIKQPKDRGILLKDILQDNPNAKYYISEKMQHHLSTRDKVKIKNENDKSGTITVNGEGKQGNNSTFISEHIDDKYYLSNKAVDRISRHNNDSIDNDKSNTIHAGYYKQGGRDQQYVCQPVDEKYYLSDRMLEGFIKHKERHDDKGTGFGFKPKEDDEKGNALRANGALCPTDTTIIVHNTQRRDPNRPSIQKNKNAGGSGPLSRNDGKTYALDTGNTNAIEQIPYMISNQGKTLEEKTDKSHCLMARDYKGFGNQSMAGIVEVNKEDISQTERLLERTGVDISNVTEPTIFDVYNKKLKDDGKCVTLTDPCHNNIRLVEPREIKQVSTNNKSNGGTQPYQQDRIYDTSGISPALSAGKSDLMITSGTWRTHKDGQGFREVHSEKGATIPARAREDGSGQNVVMIEDAVNKPRIRRLTPIECERLQTVPDNYTNVVSDTQRYKCLGNGWTIDVISHIFSYLPPHLMMQD